MKGRRGLRTLTTIDRLTSQFQGQLLVHNDLATNLGDGFLDSATLLDTVGCWQTAMEDLRYACDSIGILVFIVLNLFFYCGF